MLRLDKTVLQNFNEDECEVIVRFHKALYNDEIECRLNTDELVVVLDYLTLLDHPEGNLIALRMVENGLEKAPDDADLLQLKARLKLLFFQPEEALAITHAIAGKEHPEAYVLLAQIYAQQRTETGDRLTLESLKQYALYEPDDETAILDVVNYRADRINYTLYMQLLKQVFESGKDAERSLNSIRICMVNFGQSYEVLKDIEQLYNTFLQRQPYHLQALIGYAEILAMEGETNKAAEVATTYCSLYEDDKEKLPVLLLDAADYLSQSERYSYALKTLKRFAILCPEQTQEEFYDATRPLLKDFTYLNLSKHSYDYMMGLCLNATEEPTLAIPYLERVIGRNDVEMVGAMRVLSQVLLSMEHYQQSEQYALSAVSLSNGSPVESALSLQNLGEIYCKLAMEPQFVEFRKTNLEAAKLSFNSAESHHHLLLSNVGLAKVALMQGELDEASQWLTVALNESNENINCLEVKTALHIARNERKLAEQTFRLLCGYTDQAHRHIINLLPQAATFLNTITL